VRVLAWLFPQVHLRGVGETRALAAHFGRSAAIVDGESRVEQSEPQIEFVDSIAVKRIGGPCLGREKIWNLSEGDGCCYTGML
jgi:hypothetical protein